MENKVIVISSPQDFSELMQPILQKLEKMEALLLNKNSNTKAVYSDAEAAKFLSCSTKKLQSLRNAREIGFIRENGGRKILYRHEHLMEYLAKNELKKIK